jgi:hypothetical protein
VARERLKWGIFAELRKALLRRAFSDDGILAARMRFRAMLSGVQKGGAL